jgi:methanogenic corrinoid protein MtbC1
MYRWCSYCQKFIGQKEPFKDYSLTHGVCQSCRSDDALLEADTRPLEPIITFFKGLRASISIGELPQPEFIIAKGKQLNIRPSDLLIGVIQPLLYELGDRYESGEDVIVEEHEFSAFTSKAIDCIQKEYGLTHAANSSVEVLICAASAEFHEFGVRFLEVLLAQNSIRTKSVFPGIPMASLYQLCLKLRPNIVCISLTQPENLPSLVESLALFNKWPDAHPPKVFLGGQGVQHEVKLPIAFGEVINSPHQDFVELITKELNRSRSRSRAG